VREYYKALETQINEYQNSYDKCTDIAEAQKLWRQINSLLTKRYDFIKDIAQRIGLSSEVVTNYLQTENAGLDFFRPYIKEDSLKTDEEKDKYINKILSSEVQKEIIDNNSANEPELDDKDAPQFVNEINALKEKLAKENKLTEENIKLIDYVAKNILISSKAEKTRVLTKESESINKMFTNIEKQRLNETLQEVQYAPLAPIINNGSENLPDDYDPRSAEENINESKGNNVKYLKARKDSLEYSVKRIEITLSKDFKQRAIALMNKMDKYISKKISEYGMVSAKDDLLGNIFNANFYDAEKYIKEGNLEGLKKVAEQHKQNVKVGKEFIKLGENLTNTGYMPLNCSSTRVATIPYELRENYVATSRINSLISIMKIANLANVSYEEVLESPIQYAKIAMEKVSTGFSDYLKNKGTDLADYVKLYTTQDDTARQQRMGDVFNMLTMIKRGFQSITQMDTIDFNNKEHSELMIKEKLFSSELVIRMICGTMTKNTECALTLDTDYEKAQLFINLITASPKDRDLNTLTRSPRMRDLETFSKQREDTAFNCEQYIREHSATWNPTEKALDLLNVYNALKTNLKATAAREYINFIADNISKAAKKAGIKTMDIDKFAGNPDNFVNTNTYKKCLAYDTFRKNIDNINKDNLKDVLSAVEKMENVYKNRNFLVRWFSPSVKKEKEMIESCKTKLATQSNTPVSDINDWLKAGKDGNSELQNEQLEVMKVSLDFKMLGNEPETEPTKETEQRTNMQLDGQQKNTNRTNIEVETEENQITTTNEEIIESDVTEITEEISFGNNK